MVKDNELIIAKDLSYDMDCYKTRRNNNVLVVGASGAGKTRGIVIPNILQATGSYIICDPKGNLHKKYGKYLESKGYNVVNVDFTDPEKSSKYNCFYYIRKPKDILAIAHTIMYANNDSRCSRMDPFWDQAGELLLSAIIGYLWEFRPEEDWTFSSISKLVNACEIIEDSPERNNALDRIMEEAGRANPKSFAVSQYRKFRVAAGRTLKSIMITVNGKLADMDVPEVNEMMSDNEVNFEDVGKQLTAVFVGISDTERSMDGLANIFYTQAMNILCETADKEESSSLPVPVRFILDDFATNCKITDFPRMIASIRSRGISAMLMIQSEAQLQAGYEKDANTIVSNCDTYVYLGSNDVDTSQNVARRCDVPVGKILYMPVGSTWVFRRGERPVNVESFELEDFEESKMKECSGNMER